MNIIIITSNSVAQADYWQDKIAIQYPESLVIGVYEDWPKGAGNWLGTLYAWMQAKKQSLKLYGRRIEEELRNGASVALYHIAGKGQRLYPLTAVEHFNKSAIKLPCGEKQPQTLLEAVIKQTSLLSDYRRGRLSVFWTDQLFLTPKTPLISEASVFVTCQKRRFPSKVKWDKEVWGQYGIIGEEKGRLRHLEKVDYTIAEKYSKDGIAISLGDFSLSNTFLESLSEEFAAELTQKNRQMDVEHYLLMPLTLSLEEYLPLRIQKGETTEAIEKHYNRMQKLREKVGNFSYALDDIGPQGRWWDFGTVDNYYHSLMSMCYEKELRDFLYTDLSDDTSTVDVDKSSILVNCSIKKGKIRNSILYNVKADRVDFDQVLAIDVKAPVLKGEHALFYEVESVEPVSLERDELRADLTVDNKKAVMCTHITRDPRLDWKHRIGNNTYCYQDLADKE